MNQEKKPKSSKDIETRFENTASYIAKLSHELKTPIHGIHGVSNYLMNNWNNTSDETKKKCINAIVDASSQLTDIVNNLSFEKIFNKMIDFKFENEDIVDLTRSTVENFKNLHLINSIVACKTSINTERFITKTDKFWYKQLLMNILINAVKYSDSGTISINVDNKVINAENHIIVAISDEGIGISESELQTIFAPYKRGSRVNTNEKGLGLGLAICHEIVLAHRGEIHARNNQDRGATIEFSIPQI